MSAIKQAPSGELYTTEHDLQCACVRWFRQNFQHSIGQSLFSIPNGAVLAGTKAQRARQAQKLKNEGMVDGAADLFLSVASSGLNGLYLECKTPVGTWSADQKAFCANQLLQGYGYAVVCSFDKFERVVRDYVLGRYIQVEFDQIWRARK